MPSTDLVGTLDTATTRRRVITTGVKLAYAVPIVAASFKMMPRAASAEDVEIALAINQCGTNECVCNERLSFHPLVDTKCCVSCHEGATGASTCGGSDTVTTGANCPGGAQPMFEGQLPKNPSNCTGAVICTRSGDKGTRVPEPLCRPVYTGSRTACGGGDVVTL